MKRLIIVFFAVVVAVTLSAQAVSTEGHFLYEPEAWEPPTKELIRTFEGQPAEPFMANDINGYEQYLPNYKGRKVVLWFWDSDSPLALSQIAALNTVHKMDDVQVLSFARKPTSTLKELATDRFTKVAFPIIGNGDMFGQMAYGADLGYPRFFVIDADGIIRVVLPAEAFVGETDITDALTGIINGI